MDHITAAGPYSAEAGYLRVDGELLPSPRNGQIPSLAVDRRVRELGGQDGPVTVPGLPWGRALGLRGPEGVHGYLVVTSRSRPTEAERSLLATLVRHTAAALSFAFIHRRQRENGLELHRLREERTALQRQLISVVAELGYQRAVHALMADVAASGGGEEAITRALHGLTGLPALVEDRFWSAEVLDRPQPPPPLSGTGPRAPGRNAARRRPGGRAGADKGPADHPGPPARRDPGRSGRGRCPGRGRQAHRTRAGTRRHVARPGAGAPAQSGRSGAEAASRAGRRPPGRDGRGERLRPVRGSRTQPAPQPLHRRGAVVEPDRRRFLRADRGPGGLCRGHALAADPTFRPRGPGRRRQAARPRAVRGARPGDRDTVRDDRRERLLRLPG